MKEYEIIQEDGILITIYGDRGQTMLYSFKPNEAGVKLEVEGFNMWITVDGDRRMTIDDPVVYEKMGWIKEKQNEN